MILDDIAEYLPQQVDERGKVKKPEGAKKSIMK